MSKVTYQVTLLCGNGKYKPVSTLLIREAIDLTNKTERKKLIQEGTVKICAKRYWTQNELKKFDFTKAKVRVYNKEKIEQENQERYEVIKEQKYASGEWVKPKGK